MSIYLFSYTLHGVNYCAVFERTQNIQAKAFISLYAQNALGDNMNMVHLELQTYFLIAFICPDYSFYFCIIHSNSGADDHSGRAV
jgi:hypothetical protein